MNDCVNKRVAVVGAGIAGLSCATRLQAYGFCVEIFEKSRGPNGRMSTRQTEGWSADHGAQYFTARDPLFKEALRHWIDCDVASLWKPTIGIFEDGKWSDSSAHENRYVANPGMNALGKHLANSLSVHTHQTIEQLFSTDRQWQLCSKESGMIDTLFDFVVLALPGPQANVLLNSANTPIEVLSESINKVKMDGCWTVIACLEEQIDFPYEAGFINGEIISWICNNQSKPNRLGQQAWTIHGNPSWSQDHIELTTDDAGAQILACAKKLGLNCTNAQISTHRWRYASGHLTPSPQFLTLVQAGIGVCGDWLHGGRVEGAWLSGRKLADAIATT